MDILKHNKVAWDRSVESGNRWTQPVTSDTVNKARSGHFEIVLTPTRPVPLNWFPQLSGTNTLCLASAGGQQAPILAAAGAKVTVFDNSPRQLAQDRIVAEREQLELNYVEGDMADLSQFADESFDLIFHPCSKVFVPDVIPVWCECFRVLKPGGVLLAGFTNGMRYIFDDERKENGNLEVKYPLPYSDLQYRNEPHIRQIVESGQALEFGHTLEDQIGGQLQAGFMLTAMFEDRYANQDDDPLSKYLSTFMATRAIKPA